MPTPSILVATWGNGVFHVAGNTVRQELAGQSVRSLVSDGHGGVFAVVGPHSLQQRSVGGEWSERASSEFALSCCVPIGETVFVGTDDARVWRIDPDGRQTCLTDFADIEGRAGWYAGTAVVDGRLLGPPLGVRSMAVTCDGAALLVNVHVGGIPRSTDAGRSWRPTIAVERDVHQVCTHARRPELAIAASAAGLCISRDAGASWVIEPRGLHALHCSGVAVGRTAMFVSASTDPFAARGAVYRRPLDGDAALQPVGGGLPEWTDGIVDTDCIATRDAMVAAIDRAGHLYLSHDDGASWSCIAEGLADPSGIYIG